jgi:tripartite-type tricarboxylate transporter receptor subunit TctC
MNERKGVMSGSARLRRRAALGVLGGALAAPAVVRAQEPWPNRTVRYINPFPAGGATDTLSRLYCQKMSELTGQQFVVENRGGSGGDVGVDIVAKSAPDGYTIGLGSIASHAISPTLKKGQLPFDAAKDFTFVSSLWYLPNVLITNLDLPAKTVPELLELLRKNPGKYSYGSAGAGTTLHLSGELLKQMAKVDVLHVPYRGAAPAIIDLIAGQIQMMFDNIPGALAQMRPGKVRGLAVSTLKRSAAAPDLPTLDEFLPGFDITSWTCVCGPAGIPQSVVDRLATLTKRALESPDLIQKYLDLGATAWWTSQAEVTAYRAKEEARLGDIIRKAGAKVD